MIVLVPIIAFALFCVLWPVFADRAVARQRNVDLERELREAHTAEYIKDRIMRFHLADNRAELKALWDEQYALIRGGMNGDYADWYVDRLWHGNRRHWGYIIAAKGRVVPDEMSA